jgi:hypothetical protein
MQFTNKLPSAANVLPADVLKRQHRQQAEAGSAGNK